MSKRWPAIRITLILLYLGVLPLTPDTPLVFALALVGLALVAAVPVILCVMHSRFQFSAAVDDPLESSPTEPGIWQLLRPAAPGTRGTVRARAPSRLAVVRG